MTDGVIPCISEIKIKMADSDVGWEVLPSYYEVANGIYLFLIKNIEEIQSINYSFPRTTIQDALKYFRINLYDVLLIVLMALVWTSVRHIFTEWIFKPSGKYYDLTPSNQKKMPESAWKFLYYFSVWTAMLYIVLLKGSYAFFQRPSTVWDDWDLDSSLPYDIYVIYMIQCSYYLHSLYATIFQDVWRRDSSMMVVHHILTLVLLALSYALRCHKIGLLVLLFHDISDIQLEFTKLMVYFKIQSGKLIMAYEVIANVMFCVFAITWYMSRLYWFPLKALYAASSILMQRNIPLPFGFTMNLLLWILQAMNIYWFWFILGFIWRVATGQMKEVDDTREYDVIEKNNQISEIPENNCEKNKLLYNGISNIGESFSSKEHATNAEILKDENQHLNYHQARLRR